MIEVEFTNSYVSQGPAHASWSSSNGNIYNAASISRLWVLTVGTHNVFWDLILSAYGFSHLRVWVWSMDLHLVLWALFEVFTWESEGGSWGELSTQTEIQCCSSAMGFYRDFSTTFPGTLVARQWDTQSSFSCVPGRIQVWFPMTVPCCKAGEMAPASSQLILAFCHVGSTCIAPCTEETL